MMNPDLKELIAVSRGLKKADLVLKNGSILNVFTGELLKLDVAMHKGTIAGLGEYEGRRVIDASGKFVLPGFIDCHVHIESSLLSPAEYAKAAVAHGTTTVVADPHEIANVMGAKGIQYMLDSTHGLLLDFYFLLPSCVPATRLETSGARLSTRDLVPFLRHPRVLGLAEVMNYSGVVSAEPGMLRKLTAFRGRVIDGHAPGLTGKDLSAYIATGIGSDHESSTAAEAIEKIRLGMTVYIREGSSAKDMERLLTALTPANSRFFCFCTDDLEPDDLRNGGVNLLLRKAAGLGLDPVTAVRMATINPALRFGLTKKGAIAPGFDADMVVVDNLSSFNAEMVFKNGKVVAESGKTTAGYQRRSIASASMTINMRPVKQQDFAIKARSDRVRVIEIIPGRLETRQVVMPAPVRDGYISSDVKEDILKAAVIDRHRQSGNIGLGLVKGFGLKRGAIASSVGHDAHNISAVGVEDGDIIAAVSYIKRMKGGLVVVSNAGQIAALPLPAAGLMSDRPIEYVAKKLEEIEEAVWKLGAAIEHPFAALSFLQLAVIPEIRLTDRGLVDVDKSGFVDLFL